MATPRRIGFIVNPKLKDAFSVAERASAWLAERGAQSAVAISDVPSDTPPPPSVSLRPRAEVVAESDILVVLGGDGTLLGVARTPGSENVPILAVNMGNLGFLTAFTRDEMESALDRVLRGDFKTEQRLMIQYEVVVDGARQASGYALNDIVVRENSHLLSLEVSADEGRLFSFRGDGMIVATPTGSTAHSVAAGGPLVHPDCDTLLLTPISAFMLAMRPIVMPASCHITLTVTSTTPSGMLRADGQEQHALVEGSEIRAWRADRTLSLVRSRERDFFGVLRAKLHLGDLPRS
ncbi:MAG: NAD(+)/NADH kinase [Candidatus Poribacteria bacterium]